MAKITKVPNGPLIKKKGPFKGSTLKAGGKIKKLQNGGGGKAKKEYVDRMNTADSLFAESDRQIKDGNYLNMISNKPDWNRPLLTIGRENRKKAEKLKNKKPLGPTRFKAGGMIKRADGSMSRRGLWDNLRSKAAQNKKTGAKPKAPTKAMLTQEKRITAKTKK
jgi:hypothetical protein